MTLRLIEGFDYMPTTDDNAVIAGLLNAGQYYTGAAQLGAADWQITTDSAFQYGKSMLIDQTMTLASPIHRMMYYVGPQNEGWMGGRVYVNSNHGGDAGFSFLDAVNGANHIHVSFSRYGVVQVWYGEPNTGTLLVSSVPASFYVGEWFYAEVYTKIGTVDGEVEVRINTQPVVSLVDANTQNGSRAEFDMVGIRTAQRGSFDSATESIHFDDIYMCDPAGAVNNDWLGNVRVKTALTIADGVSTDFLIGGSAPAATNWQSVQNQLLDLTKLIYSPTVNDYDTYEMDPIVNAPYVHGVQVRSAMWQDDATQRVGRNLLRTGTGTLEEGTSKFLNQSPSFYRDIWELNPDTGVMFTGSQANAIQAGVKVHV